MERVTVLGWYGHKNIGDEAYRLAFPLIFPDKEFHFTDTLSDETAPTIVLGGGDVLNPYFLDQLRKFPKHRKLALSINLLDRGLVKHLVAFEKVFVRNMFQRAFINYPGVQVSCVPDFAFALRPDPSNGDSLYRRLFTQAGAELYEKRVVVVLNSYNCQRESMLHRDAATFERMCYEVAQLADNTCASFLFLPFGNSFPINDRIANGWAYSGCKFWGKNCLVYDELSVQDTLDLMAASHACISQRLHASIFSCISGVPFISLTHHDKCRLFLEYIGLPEWDLDYWHLDYQRMKDLLDHFLRNAEYGRSRLTEITSLNQMLLARANEQIRL